MNNLRSDWQILNHSYLLATVAWVRTRLEQFIQAADPVADPPRFGGLFRGATRVYTVRNFDHQIARLAAEMDSYVTTADPPALVTLAQLLGLSAFEERVLLLCFAVETDTRLPGLCAQAGAPSLPYPTFALALRLFESDEDGAAWDALTPERPLRYWQLINVLNSESQPLLTSALRIDERIAHYIRGVNQLDDRLTHFLRRVEARGVPADLPPSHTQLVENTLAQVSAQQPTGEIVVQLVGQDRRSSALIAQHVAARLHYDLLRLPNVTNLPRDFVRLWQRESLLYPLALYVEAADLQPEDREQIRPLLNLLTNHLGLVMIDVRSSISALGASIISVDVDSPTPAEQRDLWTQALKGQALLSPALLSEQFVLDQRTICEIVQTAQADGGIARHDSLWAAALERTRPQLDQLAQRIDPRSSWNDIVLPDEQLALLHQITDQVRNRNHVYETWGFRERMNRGLGITALFSGASGVGKTMAAEVIAGELRLHLYRVDLSAVVSKYIGETEKNLRRLFDAAEQGGAVIVFDEADALFGKRSEVKDSHDRYANIEINYLLQRMEAYRGVAILSTNMRRALDEAFLRRLRFVVDFPFPGADDRKRIWQRVFPAETPLAPDVDYDLLARFSLTGGNIHTITLNAAFVAAANEQSIDMELLLAAIRTELKKLQQPIRETDFIRRESERP